MQNRVTFTTRIPREYKERLQQLNKTTRIPQTRFIDEALEYIFDKYKNELKKVDKKENK